MIAVVASDFDFHSCCQAWLIMNDHESSEGKNGSDPYVGVYPQNFKNS